MVGSSTGVPLAPFDSAEYGSSGRSQYGGYNDSGDYPSYDMRDWVVANARAATARAMLRRAESELNAAVRRAQHDFQRSHAYREAKGAEREGYDAYLASRSHALKEPFGRSPLSVAHSDA